MHGGGNFGDLWRDNANFRLNAVKGMKNNDLIFLPQSLHYSRPSTAKADNTTFQTNDRTLFMFRGFPSLEYSLSNFPGKQAKYVPDMAFALGPQTPNAKPVIDVILLLRYDKEKVIKAADKNNALEKLSSAGISHEVWDFPIFGFPLKVLTDNKTVVYNYTKIYPKQIPIGQAIPHRHAFMGVRTQMANNVFSRARLVITDRLHASIMATLMGKPVIYLDNSYKKISNVRSALANEFSECTDENLHARHATTVAEAVDLALNIFDGSMKI